MDISGEWGKPAGTVEMSYKIEGFSTPLYLITDSEEGEFTFGHKVMEDGKDSGLFVTLQDEQLFNHAMELLEYIEKTVGGWYPDEQRGASAD